MRPGSSKRTCSLCSVATSKVTVGGCSALAPPTSASVCPARSTSAGLARPPSLPCLAANSNGPQRPVCSCLSQSFPSGLFWCEGSVWGACLCRARPALWYHCPRCSHHLLRAPVLARHLLCILFPTAPVCSRCSLNARLARYCYSWMCGAHFHSVPDPCQMVSRCHGPRHRRALQALIELVSFSRSPLCLGPAGGAHVRTVCHTGRLPGWLPGRQVQRGPRGLFVFAGFSFSLDVSSAARAASRAPLLAGPGLPPSWASPVGSVGRALSAQGGKPSWRQPALGWETSRGSVCG